MRHTVPLHHNGGGEHGGVHRDEIRVYRFCERNLAEPVPVAPAIVCGVFPRNLAGHPRRGRLIIFGVPAAAEHRFAVEPQRAVLCETQLNRGKEIAVFLHRVCQNALAFRHIDGAGDQILHRGEGDGIRISGERRFKGTPACQRPEPQQADEVHGRKHKISGKREPVSPRLPPPVLAVIRRLAAAQLFPQPPQREGGSRRAADRPEHEDSPQQREGRADLHPCREQHPLGKEEAEEEPRNQGENTSARPLADQVQREGLHARVGVQLHAARLVARVDEKIAAPRREPPPGGLGEFPRLLVRPFPGSARRGFQPVPRLFRFAAVKAGKTGEEAVLTQVQPLRGHALQPALRGLDVICRTGREPPGAGALPFPVLHGDASLRSPRPPRSAAAAQPRSHRPPVPFR